MIQIDKRPMSLAFIRRFLKMAKGIPILLPQYKRDAKHVEICAMSTNSNQVLLYMEDGFGWKWDDMYYDEMKQFVFNRRDLVRDDHHQCYYDQLTQELFEHILNQRKKR
jgi:hypothetical protein